MYDTRSHTKKQKTIVRTPSNLFYGSGVIVFITTRAIVFISSGASILLAVVPPFL